MTITIDRNCKIEILAFVIKQQNTGFLKQRLLFFIIVSEITKEPLAYINLKKQLIFT